MKDLKAEFDQAFTINVKVPFFLVASLAPAMAARGQGAIVSSSTMVYPPWRSASPRSNGERGSFTFNGAP